MKRKASFEDLAVTQHYTAYPAYLSYEIPSITRNA